MNKLFKDKLTRRQFLKAAGLFCLGLYYSRAFAKGDISAQQEASYYQKLDEKTVQCLLCPRKCTLSDGQRSFCRVREPKGGKLYSLVYGKPCSLHVDPMEKKPLFHFLPGTQVFSLATAGCNFRCKCCQNWPISQVPPEETENEERSPREIVAMAEAKHCPSIAYTYSEPSIFYEYMLDIAKLAKSRGIRSMYHSNGFLNPRPVQELSLYLDAANIDLKGFTPEFYMELSSGYLEPVLETLKALKENRVWLEITNLVIPGLNDDLGKITEMCAWIKNNLGEEVPLHFSRFHPQYKMAHIAPTPVAVLEKAREAALAQGLQFVYIGNVSGHPAENTYCPQCKKIVLARSGYTILGNNISAGKCRFCGKGIAGVWS